MSLHSAILQGFASKDEKPLLYHVRSSRSHKGAYVVMDGREFLTGSWSLKWAVGHAETLASFDRRRGIDADVRVDLPRAAPLFTQTPDHMEARL